VRNSRFLFAAASAVLALHPAGNALALPDAAHQAQPALDSRVVVEAVRKAIRDNYVVPAKRGPLDAVLAKGLAEGRYAVADPQELAQRINADMGPVANDKHLGIRFDPVVSGQLANRPQNDRVADGGFFRDLARGRNHGLTELKVLPGNIRYLRYDGFDWTGPESGAAIDTAAAFLRGGDAIIIDLRFNGGGSPDAVRRLASYFVPAGKKLVTFHMRSDPPTVSNAEAVPGGLIEGVPVWVLTSGGTASAAEEFASHVAGFKFGTLVGDTSAGAGYRNEHVPIPGGFVLSVSVGRPELPDGSDWEAKGVKPAIAVPAPQALARAQMAALEQLAARAQGPRRTQLIWAAETQRAFADPQKPGRALAAYAGRYGPRAVTVEGDKLVYRRDGGTTTTLLPLGGDLFAMEQDPNTRVRFTGEAAITAFQFERADGSKQEQPKDS
jgi:hypothetical protein